MPRVNVLCLDETLSGQKRLLKRAQHLINLPNLKGVRYMLEKSKLQEIKNKLDLKMPGIVYLGSGDFHHFSKLMIEMTRKKPVLVLIDHHSDMFESPGEVITCGSWVGDLVKENKIEKCVIMGLNRKDYEFFRNSEYKKVFFIPEDLPQEVRIYYLMKELSDQDAPVYLSIDKDVLSKDYAATNWDQGTMTLEELLEIIEIIARTKRLIGVDVCGEWKQATGNYISGMLDKEKILKNEESNIRILDKLIKVW